VKPLSEPRPEEAVVAAGTETEPKPVNLSPTSVSQIEKGSGVIAGVIPGVTLQLLMTAVSVSEPSAPEISTYRVAANPIGQADRAGQDLAPIQINLKHAFGFFDSIRRSIPYFPTPQESISTSLKT
jgi:hypothetical protein